MTGDISLVKMSPAVGVGCLLEWHLHTFTQTGTCMLACSRIHRFVVYNEGCRGSSKTPGGNVYDPLRPAQHAGLSACVMGVSVLFDANMAENRLRHHN